MTTFPTANPFVPNTGIKDIFIEDGVSVNAKNEKEALAVVEQLRKHFDAFYDPTTETLADSIGIVVFGQTQMKLVQSKIDADKELSSKLGKALANFKDVPEKLYFLTTVESVQGQEISHLVISLTYGRTESGGTSNAFGTLNRSGLGERIFNVAVTRGCKSLTLIHSIRASDITVSSLSYLREYLETVHRLDSSSETPSFVSAERQINNFCNSVKRQLIALGVDADRIVCGYGVTDRSLRVPLAILAPDKRTAELGIFCETPPDGSRFLDSAIRYPRSLMDRGWKLHRIFIHDWYFNRERENAILAEVVEKVITLS